MPELVIIFKISKRCERTSKISIFREGATSKGQVFFSGGGAGISDEIFHNIFYWENSMYPTLVWVRIKVWYGIKFNQYLWISLRENISIFYFQLIEKIVFQFKIFLFYVSKSNSKNFAFQGWLRGQGAQEKLQIKGGITPPEEGGCLERGGRFLEGGWNFHKMSRNI